MLNLIRPRDHIPQIFAPRNITLHSVTELSQLLMQDDPLVHDLGTHLFIPKTLLLLE